jgi:hypothetical protein
LLANTFFGHDAPSGAEDTSVGTDGDDGVHFWTADVFGSTERVQSGLVVSMFMRGFEMTNLSATKDSFEGKLDKELCS